MALNIKTIVEVPLVMPRVNMNGTTREALIKQHMVVMHAAERLMEALAGALPHGRDYQTYPDGSSFREAQVQFTKRVTDVLKIKQDAEQTVMFLGEIT